MAPALLIACLLLAGPATATTIPEQIEVPAMKTSIYVGSVNLTLEPLKLTGGEFRSTYAADVWPWVFWSEKGSFTLRFNPEDFEKLARKETVEFAGDATNHKGKPRKVTGRAQPDDAQSGRIKVRIHVDDVTLIFNGTYRLGG